MATQRDGHVRVLVTGFGPFAKAKLNPTQTLVESLEEGSPLGACGSLERCVVCSVDCEKATECVATLTACAEDARGCESTSTELASSSTVVLLHLGVFSSATSYRIERSAFNEATFRYPDCSGRQPQCEPISTEEGGIECCLKTTLPVDDLVTILRFKGHPCDVSDDAGRYLCNWIYFESLRAAKGANEKNKTNAVTNKTKRHSLFVHTPPFHVIAEETQKTFLNDLLHAVVDVCAVV